MTVVLDADALVAVDRRDRLVGSILLLARKQRRPLVTSAAVVAQVWRDGARQANLARLLAGTRIEALDPDDGRRLGVLLGDSGSGDVVDAHVASLAAEGDVILTSDADDLMRLVNARGIEAHVRRI